MAKRCYYEVLGVTRTATEVEITKAYRKLAKQYHPDQNPGDETVVVKYHEVTEAYEILRDAERRQVYDRYGHEGVARAAASPDAGDMWSAVQGFIDDMVNNLGGGGGRRNRGPRRGADIKGILEIDLLEAATGAKRTLTVRHVANCKACSGSGAKPGTEPVACRRCKGSGEEVSYLGPIALQQPCRGCGGRGRVIPDPCPTCRGAGRVESQETVTVTVPRGVDTGSRERYPGYGDEGVPGAPRGDLELVFQVREHPTFKRHGHHLTCQCAISFVRAALGGPVEVGTLIGEKVTVEVPAGAQTHTTVLRVQGHGMPDYDDARVKGDLLVQLVVTTPTELTPEQDQLFRKLAELEGITPPAPRKSLFGKLKDLITGEAPPTEKK